jgi:hypothetical protein
MASPNISELITTTLRNRSGVLADNVSDNNALLFRLRERGNVKPFSGGRTIVEELSYADNSTYKRYSGYDVLDVSPQDVFTAAEYDIKQVAVSVSISGLEQLQNAGDAQSIDLLESRIQNAEDSMMNGLAADVYSDGTANGGKQIGGLDLLVPEDPTTGIAGGINRANWSFWQGVKFDVSADGSGAASSSNIQGYMNQVAVQLVRGRDHPDLIIAGNNYYRHYLESMQAIQRVTDEKMAGAGFTSLKYYGAGQASDVVLDGGIDGNCAADTMFFLNTKYLCLRPHRGRNMAPIGDERHSINQDAMVKLIGWAGNMTMKGGKFHGRLFA